jgi:hypothetical protein
MPQPRRKRAGPFGPILMHQARLGLGLAFQQVLFRGRGTASAFAKTRRAGEDRRFDRRYSWVTLRPLGRMKPSNK